MIIDGTLIDETDLIGISFADDNALIHASIVLDANEALDVITKLQELRQKLQERKGRPQ